MENLRKSATTILREIYGPDADFREGQYEAIEATMNHRRSLVVQKTGWGKSLVYFVCCRLLKDSGNGMTIVVSPLLALMSNQLDAAQKSGLRCAVLNSMADWATVLAELEQGNVDMLFVTPESIFKKQFQNILPELKIGLFVVDEAHCISDWGHDFRLDYSRLNRIIEAFPRNVRVLGTTATANDRVVEDLRQQFGKDVYVSRGPLLRNNLYIQVLSLPDRASRFAWMAENIPNLTGSGIVYCLTARDCDYVSEYLKKEGIQAERYYSDLGEEVNNQALMMFRQNKIKVLVATIKLGMGYDKDDVAFIIHYQTPQNVVSYYQQIGRAGRNIAKAYTFLMTGKEDQDITEYFIRTAFPNEREMREVRRTITEHSGIRLTQINQYQNIRGKRIEKAVQFLQHEGLIYADESKKYYSTPLPFKYNGAYYESVKQIRRKEMQQLQEMAYTKECYNRFIINCLDDRTKGNCGFCANCIDKQFPDYPSRDALIDAQNYVKALHIPIEPRKKWAAAPGFELSNKNIQYKNDHGLCLCKYGDPGYGELVKNGKYTAHEFSDELVAASAKLLMDIAKEKGIRHITFVPSLRSSLVENFVRRLADRSGLIFTDLLSKESETQQKDMENSTFQCLNAYRSFKIRPGAVCPEKVILVDDMVDSKWTLTVCGYRLMENGCKEVYPYALADSSQREE